MLRYPQIAIVLLAVVFVAAKPAPQFLAAYTAPAAYAASPFASAVISQEYHGISSPYIASPYTAAYSAPLVASAYTAYSPYYL